ncbi:transmembrane GTPase Marf [Tetranychus urticae]|uniref:Dynamin-type G domain-containing protein n=1 Tax=Tetranychus urticae TaxID=32264 RepID=T1JSH9_TETUR|nr:transmembrane GTPase Marf [Tetranychus urticae]
MANLLRNSLMVDTNHCLKSNGTNLGVVSGVIEPIDSPLKIFVLAKRKINNIFVAIESYVEESKIFLEACREDVLEADAFNKVVNLAERVSNIREVLRRDHMKVAFFGRTSNGKSTVINSVLGRKILPSGMGHTTNCFLQVEGSDTDEAYLVLENAPDEKLNVESVSHLANALNSEKLGDATLVRIFWPKNKCSLLRDDVVLVDSPGIDVSPNLDEWIDKHCLDADLFVLVSNAESTLMRTEKAFFHKVSEKISKPNIFILNNRWDAAASEPENLDRVRKQHTDRSISFLADELKVVSRSEAPERVFFISAKEVLIWRTQESPDSITPTFPEGFQHRYFEFENFERKFEECLSKSSIKTKFDQHARRGNSIIVDLSHLLDTINKNATNLRIKKSSDRKEESNRLEMTNQKMQMLTNEVKHKIIYIVEQTEQKVNLALKEEIRRLSLLVSDFERPFSDDPNYVQTYKKELHSHVEKGLDSNMRARLSTELSCCVESAQKEMIERVTQLIPEEQAKRIDFLTFRSRQSFEILYRINCESLCADFQEDLEFRFSFGVLSMIRRFRSGNFFSKGNSIPRSVPSTAPQTPSNDYKSIHHNSSISADADLLPIIEKISFLSGTQSQTTIGALALGGFMVRTIGWRVIAVTLGVYTFLYFYERFTWTNKAKEKAFKKQYVNHATRKLKLIVDLTSANCSHQVQQELTATFARLCHMIDSNMKDIQQEINKLDAEIRQLEEIANSSRTLKNKASFLSTELDNFNEVYLNDET